MSIEDRLAVVKLAEIECRSHSTKAKESWRALKRGFKTSATPWRIVVVGGISGFLMGRSGGEQAGSSVGSKLFGSIAHALITTLGASATAGMAAGAAATATSNAVIDDSTPDQVKIAAARTHAA